MAGFFSEYSLINKFMFRPPKPTHDGSRSQMRYLKRLHWFGKIPCAVFLSETAKNCLIYFHGNAVDLSDSYKGKIIFEFLNVSVIVMEYPGYGMFGGYSSEYTVNQASWALYNFIKNEFKIQPEQIILMGNSIGTGVSISLAEKILETENKQVALIVLVSPFKSINSVIKNKAGTFYSSFFADRFTSIDKIHKLKCRILIFHGLQDTLISYLDAVELSLESHHASLFLIDEMGHSINYCFEDEILYNIKRCYDFEAGQPLKLDKDHIKSFRHRKSREMSYSNSSCVPICSN